MNKMKSIYKPALFFVLVIVSQKLFSQKMFSEGTLVYDVSIQTGSSSQSGNGLNGATNTVYLKGNSSRTDMASSLGKEITIFNSKSDNAIILKEFSGQKLMITLSKENWKAKNKINSSLKFELTSEFKIIAGYNTRKAIANSVDGKSFVVYYTPDLQPANKEYDATFTNLPGLPIEFEIESGKTKFKYSLSKISYEPVLVSLFDFPTAGYRVMTYEENQQLKKGN
jgi:GLPGLI family protein